jgi:hypothetical protein
MAKALPLRGLANAVNVTDGASARAHLGALAGAALLIGAGVEPILLEPMGDHAVRAALAARTSGHDGRVVIVGDADAWGANWSLAAHLREDATIVVHGGAREYRVVAMDAALPPLLDDASTQCWVIAPGEAVTRARWTLGTHN